MKMGRVNLPPFLSKKKSSLASLASLSTDRRFAPIYPYSSITVLASLGLFNQTLRCSLSLGLSSDNPIEPSTPHCPVRQEHPPPTSERCPAASERCPVTSER